jgi:hypothetical protein
VSGRFEDLAVAGWGGGRVPSCRVRPIETQAARSSHRGMLAPITALRRRSASCRSVRPALTPFGDRNRRDAVLPILLRHRWPDTFEPLSGSATPDSRHRTRIGPSAFAYEELQEILHSSRKGTFLGLCTDAVQLMSPSIRGLRLYVGTALQYCRTCCVGDASLHLGKKKAAPAGAAFRSSGD